MAYSEKLSKRIKQALSHIKSLKAIKMMGGIAFMVNDKMCVGVVKEEMLCRIDPAIREEALRNRHVHVMEFTGRPMKGFVLVDQEAIKTKKSFDHWISLCLEFNKHARAAKKKKK